ncbi:MAG: hypothetical protein HOE66_04240 [Planctomycetes bacterium]|nr:hypothetical protein [Planctomycetota bacterium]
MAIPTARVRKRDGFEQGLDLFKLAESAELALASIGSSGVSTSTLAEQAVLLTPVDSREMIDSAALALALEAELGAIDAQAADAYRTYRRARRLAIARLRVHTETGRLTESLAWDRERLTLALVRDRFLERGVARDVASNVERRLAAGDWLHLTGRFVAACADNECRAMGLPAEPLGDPRVGLERRHLRAWLSGDCLPLEGAGGPMPAMSPEGTDTRPMLGGELLARFAIDEIITPAQAEALASGAFALPRLNDWMRAARVRLHPEPNESETDFWRRVSAARQIAAEVQVFWPGRRNQGDPASQATELSRLAPDWLTDSACRLRLATTDTQLALDWARSGRVHRMSAAAFSAILSAEPALAEHLAEANHTVLTWQPPAKMPSASTLAHRRLDGFVVINLAQLAIRAGAWSDTAFREALFETAALAAGAARRLAERAGMGPRPTVCFMPAGLAEAWAELRPDTAMSTDRARRFVLNIRSMFDQAARELGLIPEHAYPPHAEATGVRLAETDALPGCSSYFCGWQLDSSLAVPTTADFDVTPWLEFAAAPAHSMSDDTLARRLPSARRADS